MDLLKEILIYINPDDPSAKISLEIGKKEVIITTKGIYNYQIDGKGDFTWAKVVKEIEQRGTIESIFYKDKHNDDEYGDGFGIELHTDENVFEEVEHDLNYKKIIQDRLTKYDDDIEKKFKYDLGLKIKKMISRNDPYKKELKEELKKNPDEETKERINKILQKFGKNKLSLAHKSPPVKLFEKASPKVKEIISKQSSLRECDFKEFENDWNDVNYGPVIATLAYFGCLIDGIPMKALKSSWQRLLTEINTKIKHIEPDKHNFSSAYNIITTDILDYQYCSGAYNFLVQYYEKSLCNCECGSFLLYELARRFPLDTVKPALVTTPEHIQLFMLIGQTHPPLKTEQECKDYFEQSALIYETTTRGGFIERFNYDEILLKYGFFSEQLVALQIIANSAMRAEQMKDKGKEILTRMLAINWKDDTYTMFTTLDRKCAKTLLDSNSLDILVFNIKYRTFGGIVDENNRKYIYKDLFDAVTGKIPTSKELHNRVEIHAKELMQLPKIIRF